MMMSFAICSCLAKLIFDELCQNTDRVALGLGAHAAQNRSA